MNPLINMMNNPISQILNVLKGGATPQQLANQILQQNPQAQAMLNAMQAQCGKQSPKEFVLQQCKNRGISESDVMEIASRMGLK